MAALIESESRPLAFGDLAAISEQLAHDISRLPLHTDGFTVEDYLSLDGNYLVEFDHGRLQILPTPDLFHQAIVSVINDLLKDWLTKNDPGGRRKFAPTKVMLDEHRYREPDVCCMLGKHASRRHRQYWDGADVVFEVISDSNRRHDEITKPAVYAAAGIPEYWIIDPTNRSITLLVLVDGHYESVDTSVTAASRVLTGFEVGVAALFAQAEAEE